MTKFTNNAKNAAIDNIVSFLKNPGDKSPLAQASLILETVQKAFVTNDLERNEQASLMQFMEQYINLLATCTDNNIPDFAYGIVSENRSLTVSDITRLLAKLRCLAVNQNHSDFIISHLSYFIDKLESDHNVSSISCKKFRVAYSDFAESIPELLHWSFKSFNPPIYITFACKQEWDSFRAMTNDEGRYVCKYNGVGLAVNCKTSTIDNFDNTKYPIEVRVNGIQVTDPKILNLSQEQIAEIRSEIYGYRESVFTRFRNKHPRLVTTTIISVVAVLAFVIGLKLYENKRAKDKVKAEISEMLANANSSNNSNQESTAQSTYPDSWMVGKWRAILSFDGSETVTITLTIDKYGNATQTEKWSYGGTETESFTLQYNREAQILYYREHGGTISYGVDPVNQKIYMKGSGGSGNVDLTKIHIAI